MFSHGNRRYAWRPKPGLSVKAAKEPRLPKLYWMTGYNIREGKAQEYIDFLKSKACRKLCEELVKETGMKYLETYFSVIPSSGEQGDFDAYDFYEMPNHASLDKARKSAAFAKMGEISYKFVERRPFKSVTLRTSSDSKVMWEPKSKK
jgi:hypothetical protein